MSTIRVNFKCPHCGGETIERWEPAIIYSRLDGFWCQNNGELGGVNLDDPCPETDCAGEYGYVCGDCNRDLANDDDTMYEWLKEQGMLEENADE